MGFKGSIAQFLELIQPGIFTTFRHLYKVRTESTSSDTWQLDKSAIIIDRKTILGKGAFSVVYKGTLNQDGEVLANVRRKSLILALGFNKTSHLDVAAKVFNCDEPGSNRKNSVYGNTSSAYHELAIMKELPYHANVMNLIGWIRTDSLRCPTLVLEYCTNGDLLSYLHRLRDAIDTVSLG